MPPVNPMIHGLNETVLDILKNNPLGHVEHSALDAIIGGVRQYLCIVLADQALARLLLCISSATAGLLRATRL